MYSNYFFASFFPCSSSPLRLRNSLCLPTPRKPPRKAGGLRQTYAAGFFRWRYFFLDCLLKVILFLYIWASPQPFPPPPYESYFLHFNRLKHGPNNYKDTKPLMSSLLVFDRVYRLEIQSVMLVFSTPLVNLRLSNLLTGSPPHPLLCENIGLCGEHLHLCTWPDSEPTKLI